MAAEVGGGTGAGGGVGDGTGHLRRREPAGRVGARHHDALQPGLAPLLTRLNGIVAETGSVLSHLAILAREAGVATVVGYAGAMDDLPRGSGRARRRRERPSRRAGGGSPMKIIAWVAGIATLADGRALHDRLAQPVGVDPGAVLRSHRR